MFHSMQKLFFRVILLNIILSLLLLIFHFQTHHGIDHNHHHYYFASRLDSAPTVRLSKKVLYWSIHQGTIDEMVFVSKRHGIAMEVANYELNTSWLNLSFSTVNNFAWQEVAVRYISEGSRVQQLCDAYSLIVVGMTIRGGWPFLFAASNVCNRTKIALQVVARFHTGVFDAQHEYNKEEYTNLMRNLTLLKNVYWIPNNHAEIFFLNEFNIRPPSERTLTILPYGHFSQRDNNLTEVVIEQPKTIIYSELIYRYLFT